MLTADAQTLLSPNHRLSVIPTDNGLLLYFGDCRVLEIPTLGYDSASQPGSWSLNRNIHESYTMLAGKRLECSNDANEYVSQLSEHIRMVLRLYNDGVAFRYEFSGLEDAALPRELTAWRIPEGTKRWMQNWTDSYEEYFPLTTTAKVPPRIPRYEHSAEGFAYHWGYPALFEPSEGIFVLISEAGICRGQSASSLYNEGELFRVVPANNDRHFSGEWCSPWRIAIIGSLAEVVASTLVTDVSEPAKVSETQWIHPGVVSWIYWANNHGSNDYGIICKYVDMAAQLKLPYVLIDAEWDQMKDGKTIEDAVRYALSKGVKPLIWYNSSVGWIDGAPTPKFRLNKPDDREREFAWCERMGVAGVKIDFFSGDDVMNMDYCIDLLECAARHHLLVNFHGATIPRGWQRTWPNLLSTEGVLGAEWYNNNGTFTTKAAAHNATLPFTRNVVGPMDYTPCAFTDSQYPHLTTNAHELALTVLFESALQHLADRPESFLSQPEEVQSFLSCLPTVWHETRLISGYPGESVVMARRYGTIWYVAGINGTDEQMILTPDLSFIHGTEVILFADSENQPWKLSTTNTIPKKINCQPRGGFVMVIK